MKYISEIKNRLILIIFNLFLLFNTFYFYKDLIFYLLFQKLVFKNKIYCYFIYTNIIDLLYLYFDLASFNSFLIFFIFFIYQVLFFIQSALYKNEFYYFRSIFLLFIFFNIIVYIYLIIYLFPFIWNFFENFSNKSILNLFHFEVKITDYYIFFKKVSQFIQLTLFSIVFLVSIFKKVINVNIIIKYRKIIFIKIILITIFINEITIQILLLFLLITCYECFIFYFIYLSYYKIK